MSNAVSDLVGVFGPSQSFSIVPERHESRYVVEDAARHAVAFLPFGYGGVVRTAHASWDMETERRGRGWALIARSVRDRSEAGGVAEQPLPATYRLWIADDDAYRLAQNPLSGNWSIRHRRTQLARFSNVGLFASNHIVSFPVSLATITTCAAATDVATLSLAILLSLEMIKAEASIPRVPPSPAN